MKGTVKEVDGIVFPWKEGTSDGDGNVKLGTPACCMASAQDLSFVDLGSSFE